MSDDVARVGPRHVAVLPAEVLTLLQPAQGQVFVDCTVGAGGHARAIAERLGPDGLLIGLDLDPTMLELARPRITGCRVELRHANFEHLPTILTKLGVPAVDGVLADLGFCSDQVEAAERGLSFQQSGPLDMRLDRTRGQTAAELLRHLNERDLADLIYQFGEERFSRRIARRIVEARQREPLATTEQLAELVRRCVPRPKGKRGGINPATRTFQALRIAVNDELGALERLLKALPRLVKPSGRVALISFHSLEDRLVKQALRQPAIWQPLTRKPIQATPAEVTVNPRARSAKLRAAVRVSENGQRTNPE